jgi:hypothetical protein
MSANYYKTLGRFNICGAEKDWQVVLSTDAGTVSAMWDEDDEPDIDDCPPSEVLDVIEARLTRPHFWSSDKDRKLAVIAKMRESIESADREWLTVRVTRAREALRHWEARLQRVAEAA